MSWSKHKAKWHDCERCELSERRNKVVLLRGKIPCDVLFVGEAPGESEDTLGKPFKGPAGILLDGVIEDVFIERAVTVDRKIQRYTPTYAITNLVGCIPRDEDSFKATAPPKESIEACAPRLREIVALCKPKLIVCLGQLPTDYAHKSLGLKTRARSGYKWADLMHPAAIIRLDVSQRGLAIQRFRVKLETAVDALFSARR